MALTKPQVLSIITKRSQGMRAYEIAHDLNVSVHTVHKWCQKLKAAGNKLPPVKTGRPPILYRNKS